MTYAAPADRVAYEEEPNAADSLLRSAGLYSAVHLRMQPRVPVAGNIPMCWTEFVALANLRHTTDAVIFLHERRSRLGVSQLVLIGIHLEGDWLPGAEPDIRLYKPLLSKPLQLRGTLQQYELYSWPPTVLDCPLIQQGYPLRLFAGQADPADRSHFTIGYEIDGRRGAIDGYLLDRPAYGHSANTALIRTKSRGRAKRS